MCFAPSSVVEVHNCLLPQVTRVSVELHTHKFYWPKRQDVPQTCPFLPFLSHFLSNSDYKAICNCRKELLELSWAIFFSQKFCIYSLVNYIYFCENFPNLIFPPRQSSQPQYFTKKVRACTTNDEQQILVSNIERFCCKYLQITTLEDNRAGRRNRLPTPSSYLL